MVSSLELIRHFHHLLYVALLKKPARNRGTFTERQFSDSFSKIEQKGFVELASPVFHQFLSFYQSELLRSIASLHSPLCTWYISAQTVFVGWTWLAHGRTKRYTAVPDAASLISAALAA